MGHCIRLLALWFLPPLALLLLAGGSFLVSLDPPRNISAAGTPVVPAVTPSPTPACPRIWAVASGPNVTGTVWSQLNAISAHTANDAWAVGHTETIPEQPFVEHWDGLAWNIVSAPNAGAEANDLNGVSALAADDAWAVGQSSISKTNPTYHTLTMYWNGVQWSRVASPDAGANNNYLKGVVALSASNVWAVGDYITPSGEGAKILIEHWDGLQWSIMPGPDVGTTESYLNAIAAISTNDIWAVGSYWDLLNGSGPFIVHWDGTSWTVVPTPSGMPDRTELDGVTAVSASDIWAVGNKHSPQALIMHWDGTRWSQVAGPGEGTVSLLQSVSAVTSSDIWAAGYTGWDMLVEHWDGSQWSIVPGPTGSWGFLTGVAAISATNVLVAGYYYVPYGQGIAHTLVVQWDGTHLKVVPSPNQQIENNVLSAIAAVSPSDAWVVGYYNDDGQVRTLTEHWDGSQWRVVASPNGNDFYETLTAVTAVSSSDVWAIGRDNQATLTEHWDGIRWSIVPGPVTGTNDYVQGAAATSSNDVWAVGFEQDEPNGDWKTLTEHWAGTRWSVISDTVLGRLFGVAAISPQDAWAVGYRGYPDQTLTQHWDGVQWNVVPSPNPGTGGSSRLYGVAASSSDDAWAAGYYTDSSNTRQTLVEHWDGAQWSIVPSPDLPGADNVFNSVTAISSTNVWAVGTSGSQTLIEHWDGSQWSIISSPSPSQVSNVLNGVAAASPNDVWAAGSMQNAPNQQTLIDEYVDAFPDIHPSDYFYTAVRYLYCHGIISGYADGTFRPHNNATRGQMAKIVVLAEGWQVICPPTPTFTDVPTTDPFYCYIETINARGVVSGYSDGTFRPYNDVTRGQLCKIIVNAEGWTLLDPPTPTFTDVLPGTPFYRHIETAYSHGIISGYADGTFRPGNDATRGQISKIVYQAITGP